ncbi:MAG: hypothetical protein QM831_18370 [Kofleriaceae bacterium]
MSIARPIDLSRLVREAISASSDDDRLQLTTALEPHPLMVTMVETDLKRLLDLLIEDCFRKGPVLFAVYSTKDHRRVRLELAGVAVSRTEAIDLVHAAGGIYTAENHTTTIDLPRSR